MYKFLILTFLPFLLIDISGCSSIEEPTVKIKACTDEWYAAVEKKTMTSDGQGHGPDLGSLEWRSVIEFKFGIRGKVNIPPRNSEVWCDYINKNYIEN